MRYHKREQPYSRDYHVVAVDANELVVESGKTLPYPAYIGLVYNDGTIALWYPAAYTPHEYKQAATEMLEKASEELHGKKRE